MSISREEKGKLVLDHYYNKGYTYRDLAKELKMSPNQIRDVIKRNEEKNDATANIRRRELALSSKAYQLFSKGKTNVQVAIKLNIPQTQVTQFRLEYWKLKGQDTLETLHAKVGTRIFSLWKIYKELVIERGMSLEEVAKVVGIALHELPDMESLLDEATRAAAMKQVKVDILEDRICSLKEEEKRRTLALSSYHSCPYYYDRGNSAMNILPSYSVTRQPSPLPYQPSALPDLSSEYGNEQKNSEEKKEIREVYEGDIAD